MISAPVVSSLCVVMALLTSPYLRTHRTLRAGLPDIAPHVIHQRPDSPLNARDRGQDCRSWIAIANNAQWRAREREHVALDKGPAQTVHRLELDRAALHHDKRVAPFRPLVGTLAAGRNDVAPHREGGAVHQSFGGRAKAA